MVKNLTKKIVMDQIKKKMRQLRADADAALEKCDDLEAQKKALETENDDVRMNYNYKITVKG